MPSPPARTPWSFSTKPACTPRANSRSRKTSPWCRYRRHVRNSTRRRTSGNICARPIFPTACLRPTPIFSMPVRKPGKSSSMRPDVSPPSRRAIGQSSIKQFEAWYYYVELGKIAHFSSEIRLQWEVTQMTDEPIIEQLLEPSTVLSRALDFMETDLDAEAYNAVSAWVARAIREISEDLARVQAIDPEALEGLPAARMKIEGGKLWLRIFEEIQGAITRYASGWEA